MQNIKMAVLSCTGISVPDLVLIFCSLTVLFAHISYN